MGSTAWSYTAVFSAHSAVIARSVKGLPGLCMEPRCESFSTWTEAECHTRALNEDLGLSPLEARTISTEATLSANSLISECDSLIKAAKLLQKRNEELLLAVVLAQIELGVTFCRMACGQRPEPVKCRLLGKARKIFINVVSAMERRRFSRHVSDEILAGTRRLEEQLESLNCKYLDVIPRRDLHDDISNHPL